MINLTTEAFISSLLLAVVLVLVILFRKSERKTASPTEAAIRTALLPYIYEALHGATSLAEKTLHEFQAAIEHADKKRIADSFYALLPDVLRVDGVVIPIGDVKAVFSLSQWEALVQHIADVADAKLTRNEAWLWQQVDKFAAAELPPTDSAGAPSSTVNSYTTPMGRAPTTTAQTDAAGLPAANGSNG